MSVLTNIRLIDRQQMGRLLQEIYAGPDGRRVRFLASPQQACSEVWSGTKWEAAYCLLEDFGDIPPEQVLTRLFKVTGDILGWSTP